MARQHFAQHEFRHVDDRQFKGLGEWIPVQLFKLAAARQRALQVISGGCEEARMEAYGA